MANVIGNIDTEKIIALGTVMIALAVAFGKAFGPYQMTLSQWVIDALKVKGRYRGLVNLAVGLVIATGFSVIAAYEMEQWAIVAVGAFAGFLASIEAGRQHDDDTDRPP